MITVIFWESASKDRMQAAAGLVERHLSLHSFALLQFRLLKQKPWNTELIPKFR